jgi:hypothetical protein
MTNPWLDIPLSDYEEHTALPAVAQAPMLARAFGDMLAAHRPRSVAVVGCAGGNGFERIDVRRTERVVGIDINPQYLAATRNRFGDAFAALELLCIDVQRSPLAFAPVDLLFAGLIFEYVDASVVVPALATRLRPGGVLGSVLQLPATEQGAVTPTCFVSLQHLAPVMRLLPPEQLIAHAERTGLQMEASRCIAPATGKRFQHVELRARQ